MDLLRNRQSSATAACGHSRPLVGATLGRQAGARSLDHRTGVVHVLQGRAPGFEDHPGTAGRDHAFHRRPP
ncbi:hypothetical protein [Streptomyces sp. NBC_01451]|uniref:hypothetical protein n=1 Tax=Streptomyces sp. NBC_01451 TaxID=2903872 RepID=UPI002E357DBB|nr:hypothetical protein [Streptomyces sp. NBC_01451]